MANRPGMESLGRLIENSSASPSRQCRSVSFIHMLASSRAWITTLLAKLVWEKANRSLRAAAGGLPRRVASDVDVEDHRAVGPQVSVPSEKALRDLRTGWWWPRQTGVGLALFDVLADDALAGG